MGARCLVVVGVVASCNSSGGGGSSVACLSNEMGPVPIRSENHSRSNEREPCCAMKRSITILVFPSFSNGNLSNRFRFAGAYSYERLASMSLQISK